MTSIRAATCNRNGRQTGLHRVLEKGGPIAVKRPMVLAGLSLVLLACFAAWQVTACYLANSELQSDMRDLAVQNPARTGLAPISTEQELRGAVIACAKEHGIPLAPEQVTVKRSLTPGMLDISLAADYDARVNLLGLSFPIHFTPMSSHRGVVLVK